MIDFATIERIQSAAQIYDVVSDFITLRKRGVNYVGLCPFHEDKTPSFYISPAKNICKCFACGEGGTPVHFVMKHEQLSYVDALKFLAKKYGIEVKEVELTDEQKQVQSDRESMFIINGFAQKNFTHNLFEVEEGQLVGLSYFRERGFREDTIKKFQLGYALEARDAFAKEALKAGYKKTFLEKTGLIVASDNNYVADRFRGRVIFPVHSLSGKVVAFGGRTLKKDAKIAKYVNSPESEIYHKSNELYGLYFARQAIVKKECCFLVEGYTDVISMHQAGIENVVSSSGTALTTEQIRLIHRFTNNVTVLYDGDAAGIKAAIRGIDKLLEAGLNIKIVLLPEGEDPDSFSRKQSASEFNEFIKQNETDFVRFKTSLLIKEAGSDTVKNAQMITEIVDTIAIIPEEIIRLLYVKECAKLLDLEEKMLVRNIAKRRNELLLQQKKQLPTDSEKEQTPNPESRSEVDLNKPQPHTVDLLSMRKGFSLDKHEKSILYYVVRYGERIFYQYQEEESGEIISVQVIEYIVQELRGDDLLFENPLYQRLLDESFEKRGEENFSAESYFTNHVDPDISRLAVDLSTDKYIESKIHKSKKGETEEEQLKREIDMLLDQVPYVIINYKDAILRKKMDELNVQIKEAEEKKENERLVDLLQQLSDLWKEQKKELALHLRERIIIR